MTATPKPAYWRKFEFGDDGLGLRQVDRKHFVLLSDVTYTGELGIDVTAANEQILRTVKGGCDDGALGQTDLASIPGPFRWWVGRYGVHTPAALIHDYFIGEPGTTPRPVDVSEQQIDTYFRTMLKESDVGFLRRWIIWSAVAYRTRLKSGGPKMLSLVVWSMLALVGLIGFVVGVVVSAPVWLLAVLALLPIPAAGLWGEQVAAGLVIAYVGVPFLAAPALLAALLSMAFDAAEGTRRESWDSFKEAFGPIRP